MLFQFSSSFELPCFSGKAGFSLCFHRPSSFGRFALGTGRTLGRPTHLSTVTNFPSAAGESYFLYDALLAAPCAHHPAPKWPLFALNHKSVLPRNWIGKHGSGQNIPSRGTLIFSSSLNAELPSLVKYTLWTQLPAIGSCFTVLGQNKYHFNACKRRTYFVIK